MTNPGVTLGVRVADLSLDEQGRVVIDDPQVADMVAAAGGSGPDVEMRANNCHGGNCARGCGAKPQ